MRLIVTFTLLAIFCLTLDACGSDAVGVGGDFGRSWLKNFQSQAATPTVPTTAATAAQEQTSGLWSWGGVPKGHKVVEGALIAEENKTNNVTDYDFLWLSQWRDPMVLNQSPSSFGSYDLSPFYSTDPWVLAQHYERPVRTPEDWLPEDQR